MSFFTSFGGGSYVSIGGNGGVSMMSYQRDAVTVVDNGSKRIFVVDGKEYDTSKVSMRVELTLDDGKKVYIPYTNKLVLTTGDGAHLDVEAHGELSVTTGKESKVKTRSTNGSITIDAKDSVVEECSTTNGNIRVTGAKSVGRCSTTNGNVYK
jgi:DUF4097 and DUF4098 domain-containing protein YvlB